MILSGWARGRARPGTAQYDATGLLGDRRLRSFRISAMAAPLFEAISWPIHHEPRPAPDASNSWAQTTRSRVLTFLALLPLSWPPPTQTRYR